MLEKIYLDTKENMEKVISHYQKEISIIRTGRASKDILDIVKVDYYGSTVPLNNIANITAPDPQMILIQPFDLSSVDQVEKAIISSDLGMNPNNDGKVIRLSVPPLTEERRGELVKLVNKLIEDGRISMRNIRRDSNEKLKKAEKHHDISEDNLKRFLENIQKLTDEYINRLNDMQKNKEKEISL